MDMQTQTQNDILHLGQVARVLSITTKAVLELTRARAQRLPNPLPVIRIHRRCIRVKRSDLMAWLEKKRSVA